MSTLVTADGIRSLYAFNAHVRGLFLDALSSWTWDEITANRETSYPSVRDIVLHILECEEWWIHNVATKPEAEWDRVFAANGYDFSVVRDLATLRARSDEMVERTRVYLATLDDAALETTVPNPRPREGLTRFALHEVLLQMVIEEIHHRGELIAIYHQMDREVPETIHWIAYLTRIRSRSCP